MFQVETGALFKFSEDFEEAPMSTAQIKVVASYTAQQSEPQKGSCKRGGKVVFKLG